MALFRAICDSTAVQSPNPHAVTKNIHIFQLSLAVYRLTLPFLLSELIGQESGICTTAVPSGSGWNIRYRPRSDWTLAE